MTICALILCVAIYGIRSIDSCDVWPLPVSLQRGSHVIRFQRPSLAHSFFKLDSAIQIPLLARAFARYEELLFNCSIDVEEGRPSLLADRLEGIDVFVGNVSEVLRLGVDESYALHIPDVGETARRGSLRAASPFGVLRALESVAQLTATSCATLACAPLSIHDAPRFQWRGMMVDMARHFQPLAQLMQIIDGMEQNKFNVLHLHLTDAQSFPLLLKSYPSLAKGAFATPLCRSPFNPLPFDGPSVESCTYTPDELRILVEYANDRGIRVVPEIDLPGHSASWCVAFPEMCISCNHSFTPAGAFMNGFFPAGCSGRNPPAQCRYGYLGILDPSKEITWRVLQGVISELSTIFGGEHFHIGMDEAHWDCYDRPHIKDWMAKESLPEGDFKSVLRYFMGGVLDITEVAQRTPVVWNEGLDQYGVGHYPPVTRFSEGLKRRGTIIQSWYWPYWYDPSTGLQVGATVQQIADAGFQALVAFPWYLSPDPAAGSTFESMYLQDVISNKTCTSDAMGRAQCTCYDNHGRESSSCYEVVDPDSRSRVLGGEAIIFCEPVNGHNLLPTAFVSGSVVAERLWSPRHVLDVSDAWRRLAKMRERMAKRGFADTQLPRRAAGGPELLV